MLLQLQAVNSSLVIAEVPITLNELGTASVDSRLELSDNDATLALWGWEGGSFPIGLPNNES